MPRRNKTQLEKDRAETARLYCQGWLQSEIAEKLRVDQSVISDDLKAIRAEWLASSVRDFDEARAQELAKIDHLELTYWEGWQRSCEDAETVVKKIKGDGDKELQQTTRGQAGDPRFLGGVQWCIERRCKLLGFDAPERHELTGKDGKPIEFVNKALDKIYGDNNE